MRLIIDSTGIRLDDGTLVIDDHVVLVSAAQAARAGVSALERAAGLLPPELRSHAGTVVRDLQSDRLCTERTLDDLTAFMDRLADLIEAGTTRIPIQAEFEGGRGYVECHHDDLASECCRIVATLEVVRRAVALALDSRRAVRLLETTEAGIPPSRVTKPALGRSDFSRRDP